MAADRVRFRWPALARADGSSFFPSGLPLGAIANRWPRAAPAAAPHRASYRPDIDGLRALAVLPVVLYHAGFRATSGGFVGVDIFFVISGYVISKSLLADIEAGKFSVTGFYERRIRRIFPALFVTLVVTWAVSMLLLLPSYQLDYSRSLFASSTFLSNVYFWKNSGYFANGANLRPLLHTWSLSVEEQFYIFAPLTLFVIFRFFRKKWVLILAPAALVSLGLSIYATKVGPTANFFLLPMRAWEFLLGGLLALRPPPALKPRWARELLAAVGAALIIWPVVAYTDATAFPGLSAVPPCLGAAILIYVGSSSGSLATGVLSLPPLVAVGLISYSLYLVHWPIISFLTYYDLRSPRPAEVGLILAASLILAGLSWRFVEQPFRSRRFSPSRPVLLATGVGTMAFAAALGAIGVVAHGFPGRFPQIADQTPGNTGFGGENVCFLDNNPDPSRWKLPDCTITHGPGGAALLWGDSYAAHYVAGVEAWSSSIPYSIIEYTAAGCPPVLSYSAFNRPNCERFNQNALSIIRRNNVKIVVLSARWVDLQRRSLEQLRSTLDTLSGLGVTTYVIGQSPMFATDVHLIAFRRPAAAGPDAWPVSFDPRVNAKLAAIAGANRFIDPLTHLCRGASCPFRDHGQLLFDDDGHFSALGSTRAVGAYFPLLNRPATTSKAPAVAARSNELASTAAASGTQP